MHQLKNWHVGSLGLVSHINREGRVVTPGSMMTALATLSTWTSRSATRRGSFSDSARCLLVRSFEFPLPIFRAEWSCRAVLTRKWRFMSPIWRSPGFVTGETGTCIQRYSLFCLASNREGLHWIRHCARLQHTDDLYIMLIASALL